MGKRWLSERKRDFYYRKAKKDNYRSRAAFKLKQIDERFFIIKPGDAVLDLGANPGGWSQVAAELAGEEGVVVAIDYKTMEPVSGVTFIRGDARKKEIIEEVREALAEGGRNSLDIVISDMAPNISGNYDMDQARSVELCEAAMAVAEELLHPGGRIVMKVFEGDLFKELVAKVKDKFSYVRIYGPRASRASSSEIYIVGKGYHRARPRRLKASEAEADEPDA